jgi:hypothetical protein
MDLTAKAALRALLLVDREHTRIAQEYARIQRDVTPTLIASFQERLLELEEVQIFLAQHCDLAQVPLYTKQLLEMHKLSGNTKREPFLGGLSSPPGASPR